MKRSCYNTSLASIARIKSLSYFYPFRQQMSFLKELKQKAKLARNCPKCNPRASKLTIFFFCGGASYPPGGGPPPTPTPTWHCVPRWRLRPHFWSRLLQHLSWLFQTLTKTLYVQRVNQVSWLLQHIQKVTIQVSALQQRPLQQGRAEG